MKVLLHTGLSPFSGYGRDGIGLAQALLDRGHEVRLSPSYIGVPIPREIAGLLTEEITGPFDLALHHGEPERASLVLSDALVARQNVLWTMWGWPNLPDEPWVHTFAEQTTLFDQIVVYDPDTAAAFAPVVDDDRLRTVLGGYHAEDWSLEGRTLREGRPFTFGMNGRLTPRKGTYITFEAFGLFTEQHPEANVALRFRSTEPTFPPQFPLPDGVTTEVARSLPPELKTFYQEIDTLVCPSWAEAKHLPPIEALACGTPVILSDIPGHRTWATSEMVTWVKAERRLVTPGYRGGVVSAQDLADAMWDHYSYSRMHQVRAAQAARMLPAMLDWTKCVERLGLAIGLRL